MNLDAYFTCVWLDPQGRAAARDRTGVGRSSSCAHYHPVVPAHVCRDTDLIIPTLITLTSIAILIISLILKITLDLARKRKGGRVH